MGSINAFIAAAGRGERLRPITNYIPKPLLPILGSPVIDRVLSSLMLLPVDVIGINIHHKSEMMKSWALASPHYAKIRLFTEDKLLGTGGGIKNAESLLGSSDFMVHNADVVTDIDLQHILNSHKSSGNLATLAVHNFEAFNNVWINSQGQLAGVGRDVPAGLSGGRLVAFTGIAVYRPEFLEFLPKGESSVVDAWLRAASKGLQIGCVDVSGSAWRDIGSPSSYAGAVRESLAHIGERFHIASAIDCSGLRLEDWAVLEKGCKINKKAKIARSLILPGTSVEEGIELRDVIAGPDFSVNITQKQRAGDDYHYPYNTLLLKDFFGDEPAVTQIGFGGSDRAYFRIRSSHWSAVLLKSSPDDPDLIRQTAYSGFFQRHNIPVPMLLAEDKGRGELLFEDLGDVSLYDWLKCRRTPGEVEQVYMKIMDILILLHTVATGHVSECAPLMSRLFDYEHLRWETGYFLERFVKGLRGIETDISDGPMSGLGKELHKLAAEVAAADKTIVHRDLQSQNIMIVPGDIPRIIDYQGARMGPPAYDLASLLWDPYFEIRDEMRSRLLGYYLKGMQAGKNAGWTEDTVDRTLLLCRLQRHMQALGAYGFLARVKGKAYFLRHVPAALAYLRQEVSMVRPEYPALYDLVYSL